MSQVMFLCNLQLKQQCNFSATSSGARKDLTQQLAAAGGDPGAQLTGGGSTGENK